MHTCSCIVVHSTINVHVYAHSRAFTRITVHIYITHAWPPVDIPSAERCAIRKPVDSDSPLILHVSDEVHDDDGSDIMGIGSV